MTFYPMIPMWILAILFVLVIVLYAQKNLKRIIFVSLLFGLLFMINLRGKMNTGEVSTKSSNLDLLFIMDNSLSMAAEDYNGKGRRIDAVVNDIERIIARFQGSKYGLIVFNQKARIICPYTSDSSLIKNYVKSYDMPSSIYANGSNMNSPIDITKELLANYKPNGDRKRVLFFISDGEIENGDRLASYKDIRQYIHYAVVLGYGTTSGGKMVYPGLESYYEKPYYIKDKNYKDGVSKIDESNLRKIASDLGGEYVHVVNDSSIEPILNRLENQAVFVDNGDTSEIFNDTYYYFATPLLIILFILFIGIKRKI